MNLMELKKGLNKISNAVEKTSVEAVNKFGKGNFDLKLIITCIDDETILECNEEISKEEVKKIVEDKMFTRSIRKQKDGVSYYKTEKISNKELESSIDFLPPIAVEISVDAHDRYVPSNGVIYDINNYRYGKKDGIITRREFREIVLNFRDSKRRDG